MNSSDHPIVSCHPHSALPDFASASLEVVAFANTNSLHLDRELDRAPLRTPRHIRLLTLGAAPDKTTASAKTT